jgi:hypothetical protein
MRSVRQDPEVTTSPLAAPRACGTPRACIFSGASLEMFSDFLGHVDVKTTQM